MPAALIPGSRNVLFPLWRLSISHYLVSAPASSINTGPSPRFLQLFFFPLHQQQYTTNRQPTFFRSQKLSLQPLSCTNLSLPLHLSRLHDPPFRFPQPEFLQLHAGEKSSQVKMVEKGTYSLPPLPSHAMIIASIIIPFPPPLSFLRRDSLFFFLFPFLFVLR